MRACDIRAGRDSSPRAASADARAVKSIAFSASLNAAAAAAGVLGTTLIVWHFGLAIFGVYTVALAKVAIILLGTELLPSSYIQFRLQDDPAFADAAPTFYLIFAAISVAIGAAAIELGAIAGSSWFILPYLFCATLQRGFDSQILARGAVSLSVSVPLISNSVRAALLAILILFPILSVPDALWGSLFAGLVMGQCAMLLQRPEIGRALLAGRPVASLCYLLSLRREYAGYYVNSVLKRAKDTLFPLFCDAALPSKAELGRILVFTRASDAVAGQIRVLELFLIHRETRAELAATRRRILIGSAMLGHVGVVVLASFLLWKHGLTGSSILYAAVMGLFMYPYVYELAKRSDAYASLQPGKVTFSLIAFIVTLGGLLTAAWMLHIFVPLVLIGSIVLAQAVSAFVYLARDPRVSTRLRPASPEGLFDE